MERSFGSWPPLRTPKLLTQRETKERHVNSETWSDSTEFNQILLQFLLVCGTLALGVLYFFIALFLAIYRIYIQRRGLKLKLPQFCVLKLNCRLLIAGSFDIERENISKFACVELEYSTFNFVLELRSLKFKVSPCLLTPLIVSWRSKISGPRCKLPLFILYKIKFTIGEAIFIDCKEKSNFSHQNCAKNIQWGHKKQYNFSFFLEAMNSLKPWNVIVQESGGDKTLWENQVQVHEVTEW